MLSAFLKCWSMCALGRVKKNVLKLFVVGWCVPSTPTQIIFSTITIVVLPPQLEVEIVAATRTEHLWRCEAGPKTDSIWPIPCRSRRQTNFQWVCHCQSDTQTRGGCCRPRRWSTNPVLKWSNLLNNCHPRTNKHHGTTGDGSMRPSGLKCPTTFRRRLVGMP